MVFILMNRKESLILGHLIIIERNQNVGKIKVKGRDSGNKDRIKYTINHRKAFRIVEKQLLGYNTIRSIFHDLDKVFLYMIFDYKKVHNWHRHHSRHHLKAKTHDDYIEMVIDWECARITKPDKPLNARNTLYKIHPELKEKILPILDELKL